MDDKANQTEPLVIVTACDDNYVKGAAAAIRSAIDSVPADRAVRVFVLDGGITDDSKAKLLRSWGRKGVSVDWLKPDLDMIRDMPVSDHISLSTYLRILLAELVPKDIDRAIYLDADTIVVRNLEELWAIPLDGPYCLATQDCFVPFVDPEQAMPHPVHAMTFRGFDPRPIPNYRELGLDPKAPYFNAGIMLVNVARWREDHVARRAFECLRDNGKAVRWWDQYALNVLFSGQWKRVDPRWNQNSHMFRIPTHELSHYSEAEFNAVRNDPFIVHFDYIPKPWDLESKHRFRKLFFKSLDRTAWRGWRPGLTLKERAAIAAKAAKSVHETYRKWRRNNLGPVVRELKSRLLGRRRRPGENLEPVVVVSAADDNYALPLAVTIRSAIDQAPINRPLIVNILDGGLSEGTKDRLQKSWDSPLVTVNWLQPPIEKIADLKTENHLNLVTYLRLFMPSLLPELDKVIFLDADLLIQRDLWKLWCSPLGDAPIMAVNDYYTPYLNTRHTIGRPSICERNPEKCYPIPNYRELGLKSTAGYFNAGVMLVNLKQWREMDVFSQAVRLVRENWEHVRYCDQYALNVLFSEKWEPLDPRWNQNSNLWAWNSKTDGAFDPKLFRQLRNDPWIIHFTWTRKPWHYGCVHPATRKFFAVVDRTDWRGWRPAAPPRTAIERVGEVYQQYRAWYRQNLSPTLRSLKTAVGLKKAA
jgi:lipopolysaccharide biosynthesis glycosyltransferase